MAENAAEAGLSGRLMDGYLIRDEPLLVKGLQRYSYTGPVATVSDGLRKFGTASVGECS